VEAPSGVRPNIAMLFGTEKLEWCGYSMVKAGIGVIAGKNCVIHA